MGQTARAWVRHDGAGFLPEMTDSPTGKQGVKLFAPNCSRKPQFCPHLLHKFMELQTVNDSFSVLTVQKYLTYVRLKLKKKNGFPPDWEQNRPFNTQSTFRF